MTTCSRISPLIGYGASDACVGLCHYMRILEMAEKKRKATLADPELRRKACFGG